MPAVALKCKECRGEYELEASYVCERCFGPLEVSYDYSALDDPAELRRKIQAGPPSIWRYADFLPFDRRPRMATLTLDTAGAADHAPVRIPYRDADVAHDLLHTMSVAAETAAVRW